MEKKWTKENCIIAAKKCKSRSDYKKRFAGAWDSAFNNKWLNEIYSYLENPNNITYKWTKENSKLICDKYNIYSEFIKNEPKVYDFLKRKKWIDKFCEHMIRLKEKNNYWTKERCLECALRYTTKKDWSRYSYKSYRAAHKNNWVEYCSLHMKKLGSNYYRLIYSFEFNDNSVYVGLTYFPENRKEYHLTNEKSSVFKYILKTNKTPIFNILTKYMKKELASKFEGKILKKYKKEGWNILNKIKTGGLGGNTFIWNKNKCILEAKKYKTRGEFKEICPSGYSSARRHGWINKCCNHMKYIQLPNGYWKDNKDICIEEAKKYKKMHHFKINSSGAYNAVVKNGWYIEFKEIFNNK